MSIDLGNTPVGTPPSTGEKAQIRAALGIGASDTVEFGGFVPPSGTTAEIDAVSDAVAGQVMFDTDRKQIVRFTGSATYEVVSSRSYTVEDSLVATTDATLASLRLFESGLIVGSADVYGPDGLFNLKESDQFSASASGSYLYHTGEQGPAGWYMEGNVGAGVKGATVVPPNKLHNITNTSTSEVFPVKFNKVVASSTADNDLLTLSLIGGVSYRVELTAPVVDLAGGNVRFYTAYTGAYSDSFIQCSVTDTRLQKEITTFNGKLNVTDSYLFSVLGSISVDSPKAGVYKWSFLINPSTTGSFTFGVKQNTSNVDGILIDKTRAIIEHQV